MHHTSKRLLLTALLGGLLSTQAVAQNTITLEGAVKGDGAPIASAQVSVLNISTGEAASTITRTNGEFRVLGLSAGATRST